MVTPFNNDLFNEMPVIAIMRNFPAEKLHRVVSELQKAGFSNLEITMNSPDAAQSINRLRSEWDDKMNIGAGTVCTTEQLQEAIDAGAQFIVTPVVSEKVIKASADAGIPVFPGAFSPTEIYNAWQWGATMVKVFPATKLGAGFIKDVLEPLNHVKLIPTGGINIGNFTEFLKAGAKGVGIASALFPKELIGNDQFDQLGEYYRDFISRYHHYKKENP